MNPVSTTHNVGRLGLALLGAALALLLCHTVAAGGGLPPGTFAGPCDPWVPVNAGAFGMDSGNSYSGEEGFEVAVFAGQLYVGMEADNAKGARLWRTRAGVPVPTGQADWEEVAADGDGFPFGNPTLAQNDHIDSLAAFDGMLYASTANRSGHDLGTRLYRSPSGAPGSWTSVITPGFGDVDNVNFKDMVVVPVAGEDWLCGGTANSERGAAIWCTTDGLTWTQRSPDGFGVVSNTLIASTGVFSEGSGTGLYVGVCNDEGGGLWRTTDLVTWTQVFTAADRPRVEVVGAFDGALYLAAGAFDGRDAGDPALRLYRSPSGDPGTWAEVGSALGQDPHNTRTIVDGATVYNGALYVATMNATTGAEVWRTTEGVTWTQVNADGFGATTTFASELITFNGYLYAWTSDYATGQRVLRTGCPIAEAHAITEAGRRDFPGVGAVVTLTAGALDVVTVSVLPGAPPTAQTSTLPVARTYRVQAAPVTAPFTVDLTLSYGVTDLATSDADTTTLYLSRWEADTWVACAQSCRARDPAARTVTCRDVAADDGAPLATWAIAGQDAAPTRVGVISGVGASRLGWGAAIALLVVVGCWILHRFGNGL